MQGLVSKEIWLYIERNPFNLFENPTKQLKQANLRLCYLNIVDNSISYTNH